VKLSVTSLAVIRSNVSRLGKVFSGQGWLTMSASITDCLQSGPNPGDERASLTTSVPAAFFSYSREDSEFVLRLARDLKASGANVWLDQMDIVPGQRWDEAVERALADCPCMLVVLSPAAVHSTNVMDEVSFALQEGKTVIPILYRDCAIPFRLRRVQYIDLRFEYSHGLAELLKTLAARKESPAVVPETAGHGDAEEHVAPQEDHEPAENAQSRTSLGSKALPTSQQRAPSMSSASPVQQPLSGAAKRKERGAVVPGPSRKTKAVVAACGVLIVASVLYWRLAPSLQKGVLPRHQVVQAATSNPSVSPGSTNSGALSGGNTGGEVNPSVHTGLPEVVPSIASPTIEPKGNVETREPTPKPRKARAPAETTSSTSRKDHTRGAADSSLAVLCRRAEAGDSSAMVDLGMNYAYGRGVPEDYQKAVSWLRKASEAGNAAGMNNMGVMYANGYGVARDYQQAAAWYRRAAEAGYVLAMANLGSIYENGKGVPRDSQQALGWYRKAAQAGSSSAMYDLGVMYENGEGVVKNRQQAVEWYRKAAVRGEPHAKQSLQRLGSTL
jgi:hypothetical protein